MSMSKKEADVESGEPVSCFKCQTKSYSVSVIGDQFIITEKFHFDDEWFPTCRSDGRTR
jgi:hypothetical protein